MLYRSRFLAGVFSSSALLLMIASAGATAQDAETPESVARQYYDAVQKADWKKSSELMHPDELARFKGLFAPLIESKKGAEVARELLGLDDPAVFGKLSDQKVFEQFLTTFLGKSAEMAEMMTSMRATIIGSVPEGKDTAHILYRMKLSSEGTEVNQLEVSSLRRHGNTWRMMLEQDVEGMAASLAQMMNDMEMENDMETPQDGGDVYEE